MDVDVEGVGCDKYLRVRVSLDIPKPLPRGKMIRTEGKQRWIEFKYERLLLFCFQCGAIKHVERICALEKTRRNTT